MTELPAKKKQLTWIVWRDAIGQSVRTDGDALKSVTLATNCNLGWIVDENEDRVVLANGHSTSGELDTMAIDTRTIIERIPVVSPRKPQAPKVT